MKSMKISEYLQIKKTNYIYLKLTPDTSIRNYNSTNIAKSISHMYKTISDRIHKEQKKLIIETPIKCSYLIDIYKNDVCFYFIVPLQYKSIIVEKIAETWKKVAIEEVTEIKEFSQEVLKYQMNYKREDALSVAVNKASNEPLNSVFNVIDVMGDTDRIGIFYNFIPCHQLPFKKEYEDTMLKIKENKPIDREKFNAKYMFKICMSYIIEFLDMVREVLVDVTGGEPNKKNDNLSLLEVASELLNNSKTLTVATKKKKDAIILNAQMLVLSESTDKTRESNNALAVCQSYKSIEEDNELVYKKVNNKNVFYVNNLKIAGVETNRVSVEECQNFLQLPGKDLLSQYKIKKIDVLETEVPKPLLDGVIRSGESMFKGKVTKVYQNEHKELKNTAICLCGPNRSGKSTLIANMVYDLIKAGRTVILPDFCGKCQLSDELASVIPKENILNVKCDNYENLQGFGYNEIVPKDNSIFELYNCAKMKSAKLKELINLVNDGESDLEGRMERYLEYSALVVFVNNGSVNDVFRVLKDHKLRHQYINNIPKELKETMEEYIEELTEIDEIGTKKDNLGQIIGTKQGHISAVLSRIHRLKQNAYIEMMLKKSCDNNINLLDEIQKGKLICIRMYDSMFATQQQKDIYVCYWITKVWGALQKRFCDIDDKDLIQATILIDELYQTKNCEKYLTMILSQIPKYKSKLVLSCHHLLQIPVIQEELKSASCSYMFLRGSNKKNFQAMKEEFLDKEFQLEDLLHLKQYHSLNLLTHEDGTWAGITKLPPPVK